MTTTMNDMHELAGKRIVLGLTGGIACYKSAELLRRLREAGAHVDVVMTPAATQFITPTTMQALSGQPVLIDHGPKRKPRHSWRGQARQFSSGTEGSPEWWRRSSDRKVGVLHMIDTDAAHAQGQGLQDGMAHIHITRGAHAILVAPASASFMARAAAGMANDLLSTLVLARGACPLLLAPAMNREMWGNPATQRNTRQLRADGVHLLGPGYGDQACGEVGDGRMLEPQDILAELIALFQPKVLAGRRVLVTAGPTSEAIDPIRRITNRSSGKTGYAIARACREAGADVVLVSGPVRLDAPYGVTRINAESARDMRAAVLGEAARADIFIAVAAVADWHVSNPGAQKLKKTAQPPALQFAPNPDILAEIAALPAPPWCVGFAAETENLVEHATAKRARKNVPLLVGNLAQDAMDADDTQFVLFDAHGHEPLPRLPKLAAARQLVGAIARRLPAPKTHPENPPQSDTESP